MNADELFKKYSHDYGSTRYMDKHQFAEALGEVISLPVDATVRQKPKIVCLCGSTRFINVFLRKEWELAKQGIIVLSITLLPPDYENVQEHHQAEFEGVAEILDNLHFEKIDLADEIFVINVDGYIGESTSKEIAYAKKQGKKINYLHVSA